MTDTGGLRYVSRRLRDVIDEIGALEDRSRAVPIGSPEFARLSADVTGLAREVLRLSTEQETAGHAMEPQSTTLEELDEGDDPDESEAADSGSPSD